MIGAENISNPSMPTPFSRPHVVPTEATSQRMFDWVREHLVCVPVDEVAGVINRGEVTIGGEKGSVPRRLRAGETLVLDPGAAARLRANGRWSAPFDRDIDVRYEDEDLLVVMKPSGMHVHPLGKYRDEALT